MKLATLYKRSKTGKVVYYKIFRTDNDQPIITKQTGQLGTKSPVKHYETITHGVNIGKSNETTPCEQAQSEMESSWRKKKDEGYKSLEDLDIAPTIYNSVGELNVKLINALPQFNTDSSGNVKPMLATAWEKVKDIPYPCLLQPKLDGVRCLMKVTMDSTEPMVQFFSRSGKKYDTLNHISEEVLNYYLRESGSKTPDEFILDGEIYSDELTFQEIIAAVKKQRPDSLKLKFRAYDIVNDELQVARWDSTKRLVLNIASDLVVDVPTIIVRTKEEVLEAHDIYVQQGYEGVMLRLPDGVYGQGQRSRSLLKVKVFDQEEFEFVRFEVGKREEDLIAVCLTSTKVEFKAKMTGTAKHKAELQEDESTLVGCPLTVKFFGYTDGGSIRFPIGVSFRDYE
jgi:DNA ligase 1